MCQNTLCQKRLSIDLGKRTSVTCEYTIGAKPRYGKVATTPTAVRALLEQRRPDRLVIEIGPAAGWIHDLACELNLEIQVANVNHEAWRWKNVKRKTDRDDARKLAELSAMNQLPTVHMPDPGDRQWRQLIAFRQKLVKRQTAVKNSIRAILCLQGLEMPAGKKGWSSASVQELLAVARRLLIVCWAMLRDGTTWRGSAATHRGRPRRARPPHPPRPPHKEPVIAAAGDGL